MIYHHIFLPYSCIEVKGRGKAQKSNVKFKVNYTGHGLAECSKRSLHLSLGQNKTTTSHRCLSVIMGLRQIISHRGQSAFNFTETFIISQVIKKILGPLSIALIPVLNLQFIPVLVFFWK